MMMDEKHVCLIYVFGAGGSRPSNEVEAVFEEIWDRRAAEMFVEV